MSTTLSFGAASIGNLTRAVTDETADDAVQAAWEAGIRYFDTAPHYGLGLSERRLGKALARFPRGEFVVSTKVGRVLEPVPLMDGARDIAEGFDVPLTHRRVRDYSRDGVLRSIDESLARLGVGSLDIVLVHDPDEHAREALDGAFPALEELRAQGVIRSYGAGMNQSRMLADFCRHTDLDIVMLAGRYTLLDQSALDDLLPVASRRGVSIIAAGVFNSGILANDTPSPHAHYDYATAPAAVFERAERIAAVCHRHDVPLPRAAMRFPLLHPAVATVCVGARDRRQVQRNAATFQHSVPTELWRELVSEGLIDGRVEEWL